MRPHSHTVGRRGLLVASAAALVAAAVAAPAVLQSDRAEASAPLRVHAAALDRYIGTSIDPEPLANEPIYGEIVQEEFNSITTGNTLKWDWTQPSPGQWNFDAADTFVDFAEQTDQLVRGHTLVWYNQTPGWVHNLPPAELSAAMETHIDTVMGRYQGRIAHWDVVNEPFEENGDLRDSFWLQGLGDDYIAQAFHLARAADPDADLYLNDFNVEGINAKSDAMYDLVSGLVADGVPIDGVGLQGHLILGQVPSTLEQNIARFAALGLDVAITELDIRIQLPATQQELDQQADDYAQVVNACLAVDRCEGLTVWSFTDRHSWIPEFFPGEGAALPWDEDYQPKPAYDAIHDALAGDEQPTASPTASPTESPTASPTESPDPTSPSPGDADCVVDYSVNDWGGHPGFTASVDITNTGDTTIDGWSLVWDFPAGQVVNDHWNSSISQGGSTVTATPTAWNSTINPSQTVNIGFNGEATSPGNNPAPAAFSLNGSDCVVS